MNYVRTPQWEVTGGEGVDLVVETMRPETIEQSVLAAARYSDIVLLVWKAQDRPDLVIPGDVGHDLEGSELKEGVEVNGKCVNTRSSGRGRNRPHVSQTREVLRRYHDAFRQHKREDLADVVADDCVLENVDGSRHVGKAACLAVWQGIRRGREQGAEDTERRRIAAARAASPAKSSPTQH